MPSEKPWIPTTEDYAFSKLLCYCAYQFPDYSIGQHHRRVADALEAVERGDIKRLIINMPPRHGKSMLASEYFPAWFLGRNPDKSIITSTYGQELSDDFGRKVRNQLSDGLFSAVFPGCNIANDSASAKRFNTNEGGSYFAVGVGGPLTGRGAHLLLIDDPVKNREEADSETIRRRNWDWYTSTAYTRLMPGGAVVVIMTRWHEDDLGGRILEQSKEDWTIINLPAIDDDGGALWPDRYSLTDLEGIRDTIGQRDWEALYQQRPSPREGGFFKPENMPIIDALPSGGRWVRKWDLAATSGGGDYTVGALLGELPHNKFVIGDIVRIRGSGHEVERTILNTAALDGNNIEIHLSQDPGQAGKSQAEYLTGLLKGYKVASDRESGSKETRAMPFSSQVNVGNVSMLKASWNLPLLEEMRMFPNGGHDDQVDALAGGFNHLSSKKTNIGIRRL